MEKKRKRRKDAHSCENCKFFHFDRGSSVCECEKESELTNKEHEKFWENCETGCPHFNGGYDYNQAKKDLLTLKYFFEDQTGGCCPECIDYAIKNLR